LRNDTLRIVHVQFHRVHVLAAGDCFVQGLQAPARHDDGVAEIIEAARELAANARTSAGNEDRVATPFHHGVLRRSLL
jgi:hypothetical protein